MKINSNGRYYTRENIYKAVSNFFSPRTLPLGWIVDQAELVGNEGNNSLGIVLGLVLNSY